VDSDRRLSVGTMVVQLNLDKEAVEKAWTMAQRLDSLSWQCSSSQEAVKQFLAQKSITEMEHPPPHTPHLAPNDFWVVTPWNVVGY
jgi:hypothetical protein